jgi:hypothetical protein
MSTFFRDMHILLTLVQSLSQRVGRVGVVQQLHFCGHVIR